SGGERAVAATQGLQAVCGGAAGGVGAVAEDGGDLGEGQAGEVVVGDRPTLLVGERRDRVPHVGRLLTGLDAAGAAVGQPVGGDRAPRAGAQEVDRLAVGDGDQPRLEVRVGVEVGV